MEEISEKPGEKADPKSILLAALEKKKQKNANYGSDSKNPTDRKGKGGNSRSNVSVGGSSIGHRPTGR